MMRTTLTIDDDVAAALKRELKARKLGLKELVNDALRRGLQQMQAPRSRRKRFRTRVFDTGPCLIGDIANIDEVLTIAEGEWRK
jgi:hypothetical protein